MAVSSPATFSLPSISSITSAHFECKKNPHMEACRPFVEGWFRKMLENNEVVFKRYIHDLDLDRLVAAGYPDADEEHCKTIWMLMLWLHVSDDVYDEVPVTSSEDLANHETQVAETVSSFGEEPVSTQDPLVLMFQDIWRCIQKTVTPGQSARFLRSYKQYGNATLVQRRLQASGHVPGIQEYILLRRGTGTGSAVQTLIEYALDIKLPEGVFEDQVFRELLDASADMTAWPNDLYSYNKERAAGDDQNFIPVVMAEMGCSLQEAIDNVCQRLEERFKDYLDLKKRLPSFGGEVDRELARFLTGCENFHQGAVDYYSQNRRYIVNGCEPVVDEITGRTVVKLATNPRTSMS